MMTAILRVFALGAVLLLTSNPAARAGDRTLDLSLGVGSALVLDRAFETVLIGDPNVVDVHPRDYRSVIVEPLAPGTTNLVFLDDQNIVIANVELVVHQPAINLVGKIP